MVDKKVQFIFSSATVDEGDLKKISTLTKNEVLQISTMRAIEKAKSVTLRYILLPELVKDCYFYSLLKQFEGNDIMVFVNSVEKAHLIWRYLELLGVEAVILHSFLTQKARNKAISMFKNQKVNVFITTDISSRGIDIKTVDLVINFDLPRDHKDFVHRVGRTARGGKVGLAISLLTQYDIKRLKAIEAGIDERMEKQPFDEEAALKLMSAVIKAKKKAETEMSYKGETDMFEKMRKRKDRFREALLQKRAPEVASQ